MSKQKAAWRKVGAKSAKLIEKLQEGQVGRHVGTQIARKTKLAPLPWGKIAKQSALYGLPLMAAMYGVSALRKRRSGASIRNAQGVTVGHRKKKR